jgi:hypothetical protein
MKKRRKRRLFKLAGGTQLLLSPEMPQSLGPETGKKVNRRVTILATLHELQGAEKRPGSMNDPMYEALLKQLMSAERIDFVFEEATGMGPTIAEKLSLEKLGPGRYLDVDPGREERSQFGIASDSNDSYMIGSPPQVAFASWQFLDVHIRREEFWVRQLESREFHNGLMVCGLAHVLSFAFRLHAANFSVKALEYANWHRSRVLNK